MHDQLNEQIFGIVHFVVIFPGRFVEIDNHKLNVVDAVGRLLLYHGLFNIVTIIVINIDYQATVIIPLIMMKTPSPTITTMKIQSNTSITFEYVERSTLQ